MLHHRVMVVVKSKEGEDQVTMIFMVVQTQKLKISLLFFLLNISAVENIQSKIHDMSDIVRITTSLIIIFWQWIGISVEGAGGEQ